MNTRDWCPAPPGDPCGRHRNVAAYRADPAGYGMQYESESLVRCIFDARGFASNGPTDRRLHEPSEGGGTIAAGPSKECQRRT